MTSLSFPPCLSVTLPWWTKGFELSLDEFAFNCDSSNSRLRSPTQFCFLLVNVQESNLCRYDMMKVARSLRSACFSQMLSRFWLWELAQLVRWLALKWRRAEMTRAEVTPRWDDGAELTALKWRGPTHPLGIPKQGTRTAYAQAWARPGWRGKRIIIRKWWRRRHIQILTEYEGTSAIYLPEGG